METQLQAATHQPGNCSTLCEATLSLHTHKNGLSRILKPSIVCWRAEHTDSLRDTLCTFHFVIIKSDDAAPTAVWVKKNKDLQTATAWD